MTPRVGDILGIFAPTVGKEKYHLCICVGTEGEVHKFLYLNTGDHYRECFSVPCADIPCLPESASGQSVFSFIDMPRYSDKQLVLFEARHIGRLSAKVAARVREAAEKPPFSREKIRLRSLRASLKSQTINPFANCLSVGGTTIVLGRKWGDRSTSPIPKRIVLLNIRTGPHSLHPWGQYGMFRRSCHYRSGMRNCIRLTFPEGRRA